MVPLPSVVIAFSPLIFTHIPYDRLLSSNRAGQHHSYPPAPLSLSPVSSCMGTLVLVEGGSTLPYLRSLAGTRHFLMTLLLRAGGGETRHGLSHGKLVDKSITNIHPISILQGGCNPLSPEQPLPSSLMAHRSNRSCVHTHCTDGPYPAILQDGIHVWEDQ